MEFATAMELGRNAFWIALVASAPILVIGLAVGLMISLFQAVTQLQEQTLIFVPKIAAMVAAGVIFIPWIAEQVLSYTIEMLSGSPW